MLPLSLRLRPSSSLALQQLRTASAGEARLRRSNQSMASSSPRRLSSTSLPLRPDSKQCFSGRRHWNLSHQLPSHPWWNRRDTAKCQTASGPQQTPRGSPKPQCRQAMAACASSWRRTPKACLSIAQDQLLRRLHRCACSPTLSSFRDSCRADLSRLSPLDSLLHSVQTTQRGRHAQTRTRLCVMS